MIFFFDVSMGSVSEEVFTVIESIPTLKELKVKSTRAAAVKSLAETVMLIVACWREITNFATRLTETVSTVFQDSKIPLSAQKEKMWMTFGQVRASKLPA